MNGFKNKATGIVTSVDFKKPSVRIVYYLCIVLLLIVSMICFFPPIWVLLSSMKDVKEFFAVPPTIIPKTFHPEKLIITWNEIHFMKYYVNSLFSVLGCIAFSLTFNGIFAYVISKIKPKGSKTIYMLVMGSLMIPGTMGLIPLFQNIVGMNLIDTFIPLWCIAGANAFNIVLYKNFYDTIPDSIIEAVRIDGANELTAFTKIVFPLSKPINMVVLIFAINSAWSDFLMPFLVLKNPNVFTVMVKIFSMSTSTGVPADQQVVALTFAIIPPLILYLFLQKQIMEGFVSSGIKG